jgi:hypothetical protein
MNFYQAREPAIQMPFRTRNPACLQLFTVKCAPEGISLHPLITSCFALALGLAAGTAVAHLQTAEALRWQEHFWQ